MTTNLEDDRDPQLEDLLQRVARQLAGPDNPEKIRALARRCAGEVARGRRRRSVLLAVAGGAIAAAVFVAVLVYWNSPRPAPQPSPASQLVEAPPVELVPDDDALGPHAAPTSRVVNLLLPGIPEHSWVAVLHLRDGRAQLRTATDSSCPEEPANQRIHLGIPFSRENDRPARALVVWSERPCGAALAAGLADGSLQSFDPTAEEQLVQEVAAVVNRNGNRVVRYRFVVIDPLSR